MDKIVSIEEKMKNNIILEFLTICEELKEENIPVDIQLNQFQLIVDEFYQYYKSKSILFSFVETMKGHLSDMMDDACNENCAFTVEFVLEELKLYELLDSLLAVNPKDTRKIIKRLYKKVGDVDEGRECH